MGNTFVELQNGRIKRIKNRFDGPGYEDSNCMKPYARRINRRRLDEDARQQLTDFSDGNSSVVDYFDLDQSPEFGYYGECDLFGPSFITVAYGDDGKLSYASCAPQ